MKGYKHLTTEQKTAVLASYERTKIVGVTAREVGATDEQVRHFLKRQGIPLTAAQERGTCWQHRELIRSLADQGVSLSEMSRQTGANRRHLKAFLDRHQIPYEPFRQAGENNPSWRGGRVIDKDGYVLLKRPDHPNADRHGYVREHRLVMEQVLGRYLLPTEVVHHGEEGKQNNDPSNLKVYDSNAEHLAETLTGQIPRWTPEGKDRIREAVRRPRPSRQKPNRAT